MVFYCSKPSDQHFLYIKFFYKILVPRVLNIQKKKVGSVHGFQSQMEVLS